MSPVLEENDKTEDEDLNNPSDKGYLGGEKLEPADSVVVQDVDNVGEQDQSHPGTESFPGNTIYFLHYIHRLEIILTTSEETRCLDPPYCLTDQIRPTDSTLGRNRIRTWSVMRHLTI